MDQRKFIIAAKDYKNDCCFSVRNAKKLSHTNCIHDDIICGITLPEESDPFIECGRYVLHQVLESWQVGNFKCEHTNTFSKPFHRDNFLSSIPNILNCNGQCPYMSPTHPNFYEI